ncbi:MAG: shikimate dehydrogenase [Victivallales bacterium]|nr:shikimate dehydrogenase [Victivallales bacterium]
MKNGNKRRYVVIGDPVGHSKSPAMHNAAFAALGLDAEYSAVHVKAGSLPDFIERSRETLDGFNVTVPHKEHVIPFLDEISPECRETGSVNTVKNTDGRLHGDSTDGYGLASALEEEFGMDLRGKKVLFLGCGGTVHAVAHYLLRTGCGGVSIVNRTVEKASVLAGFLAGHFPSVDVDFADLADKIKLGMLLDSTDVVVQATSLGLKDGDPSPLDEDLMRPGICMFDTIYRRTAFLSAAARRGCRRAGGERMLAKQGEKSFEIWTGQRPPEGVMLEALRIAPGT